MQGRGGAPSLTHSCGGAAIVSRRDAAGAAEEWVKAKVDPPMFSRCRTARESGRGIVSHAPSFSRAAAFERSMVVSTVQAQVVDRSSVELLHSFTRPEVPLICSQKYFKNNFPPPADVRPGLIGSHSK